MKTQAKAEEETSGTSWALHRRSGGEAAGEASLHSGLSLSSAEHQKPERRETLISLTQLEELRNRLRLLLHR